MSSNALDFAAGAMNAYMGVILPALVFLAFRVAAVLGTCRRLGQRGARRHLIYRMAHYMIDRQKMRFSFLFFSIKTK
jgi:hypothetical protein